LATACWVFIVAKSPPPQASYFGPKASLQGANSKTYAQLVHKTF